MATKEDLAVLAHTMPTGQEGVEGMINYTKKCNQEVRNLLYKECDVLVECRYCRNIFRSLINFVSHKRTYCRMAYVKVAAQPVDDDGKAETATKKRTGQVLALTKKMQETQFVPIGDHPAIMNLYSLPRVWREMPITTIENGIQKVVSHANAAIASKEYLPRDRVAVVMPQDNSSKYKEMALRNRKMPVSDKPQYRELSDTEFKIIEIFEKYDVRCANYVLLQCEHPLCAHIRPFHTLQALAYHCSLRHTKAFVSDEGEDRWPCLLCPNRTVYDLDGVQIHLLRIHSDVKAEHLRKRVEEDKSVKGRKSMNSLRRARSLSPDPDQRNREQASQEPQDNESMDELEEEEGKVDRRRRGTSARRGARGGSVASRRTSRVMERQTRVPSGNSSEDYGEPPVLQPIGPAVMDESMEDDEEAPVVLKAHKAKAQKSKQQKKKKVRSPSPESEAEQVEEKKDVKVEEKDIKVEEEDTDDEYFNSVEGCLADVMLAVCSVFGFDDDEEEEETVVKKESSVAPMFVPPVHTESSSSSAKRRGRPKKTDEEREREKNETPKVGRPPKRGAGESTGEGSVKVKRQYIRKKDKEGKTDESNAVNTPDNDVAMERASSDAARPSRHRKRPAWMMNGDMEYDGVEKEEEKKGNDNAADESNEDDQPKEEPKKKKVERGVTPKVVSVVTPSTSKTPAKKKEENKPKKNKETVEIVVRKEREPEILLFTPKSGKAVMERMAAAKAAAEEQDEPSGSRKRKQNLGKLADSNEEIMIVSVSDPAHGPKRSDLSSVPVFLSEQQQSIFFAGLVQHKNLDENAEVKECYECIYCHVKLPNIRDGRRHMVAHLRVMRLRCGLCGVGAFFCIDMRNHLQLRGCPELAKAPAHMIRSGIPCMTKEHADELTFVAHAGAPGRALFTSGKIVSILNNHPYLPDLQIEEKILGPTRVPPRPSLSPRKPPHKVTMAASVLKEAEKGTMSVAAALRESSAPASAPDAAPVLLPVEDASVRFYEDMTDPENVPRPRASASASLSYEEFKERKSNNLSNGNNEMGLPARRALSFTTEPTSSTSSTSPETPMPLLIQPMRQASKSPAPSAPTYEPILSPRPRLLPSRSTGGTGN